VKINRCHFEMWIVFSVIFTFAALGLELIEGYIVDINWYARLYDNIWKNIKNSSNLRSFFIVDVLSVLLHKYNLF
jgi:hypothetical protein